MTGKIIVSGVGCCLVDLLYNNIDFSGDRINQFLSLRAGDGGLVPGRLVFREEFVKFCQRPFDEVINEITGGNTYEKINIGGPAIVPLIHASQMINRHSCEIRFYGRGGNDKIGEYLLDALKSTPVILKDYKLINNITPSTVVLSDPQHESGQGERIFINAIGSAWDYDPSKLDIDFFKSNIVVFGGTALVPKIHDSLATLLKRAKAYRSITIVNTVYDFRNEKLNPSCRWPLGENDESYLNIDLLITDMEEALRLSGANNLSDAIMFFRDKRVKSFIITNGSNNITIYSDGRFFKRLEIFEMPVSERIINDLKQKHNGDTTGCGDNFAGGIIASVIEQLREGIGHPDLIEACCWGVVSGGFACFYLGGTYFEQKNGEKLFKIRPYYEAYRKQIGY